MRLRRTPRRQSAVDQHQVSSHQPGFHCLVLRQAKNHRVSQPGRYLLTERMTPAVSLPRKPVPRTDRILDHRNPRIGPAALDQVPDAQPEFLQESVRQPGRQFTDALENVVHVGLGNSHEFCQLPFGNFPIPNAVPQDLN